MLVRKQSIKLADASAMEPAQAGSAGPPLPALASLAQSNEPNAGQASNLVELMHADTGIAWFNRSSVRHFMRFCSVASLVSVCANTSRTFSLYPTLMLITFIVDIITGIAFTIEMVLKIHSRGFLSGSAKPYAKNRWCQFDAIMVLFIWISVLLQVSSTSQIISTSFSDDK